MLWDFLGLQATKAAKARHAGLIRRVYGLGFRGLGGCSILYFQQGTLGNPREEW